MTKSRKKSAKGQA